MQKSPQIESVRVHGLGTEPAVSYDSHMILRRNGLLPC